MAHLLDSEFDGDPTLDFPNVRADQSCPMCMRRKDIGAVACWTCYRSRGLRIVSGADNGVIASRDAFLANLACS